MTCIKAQEFFTLIQGTNFMNEYSTMFNHLTRYALEITNTEIRQMKKFMYGLNPFVARDVIIGTQLPQTYSKTLSQVLRLRYLLRG